MQPRSSTGLRASIILGALVFVVLIASLITYAFRSDSATNKEQHVTSVAQNELEPVPGCIAKSSSIQQATANTKYAITTIISCSKRPAKTLNDQLTAQLKSRNYPTLPSNIPQWGCFEASSGGAVCEDEIDAGSGQIGVRDIIKINDAAAESNQSLGTEDYLGTKTVDGYEITLTYSK